MRFPIAPLAAIVVVLASPVALIAQSAQSAQSPTSTSVPRLINISGTFRPADGQKPARVEVVTLAIYTDEIGGEPLWQETQTVTVDQLGNYSLLLGATQGDGVPLDVFASGQARWLGMAWVRPGEVEGARTPLTSVPYALRAADAATLGGKPASAYVLAPTGGEGTITAQAGIATEVVLPGTTNFLAKYVDGDNVSNSAVYESGGFVGINTTTPLDVLHARFSNSNGSTTGIAVQNLGSSATSYSGMLFYDHTGALGQFQGFNNGTKEYRINNIATGGTINFMTGSVSRFKVNNNGNIGIGTTTPDANLEVDSSAGTTVLATARGNSFGIGPMFFGRRARVVFGIPLAVQNGDFLASFAGSGYTGTDYFRRAQIDMIAAEDWTNTAQGAHIWFATTPTGTDDFIYRMGIDASGRVGINTLTPFDRLHVAGDIRVGTGANGCVKDADGSTIAGVCSSDARFKTDISPFSAVLGPLTALQPIHYSWLAAEFPERHFGSRRTYGLIAQDVEKVLPELVVTDEDGYKAVNYSKLPLLTIQALKELKAENDALKARIAEIDDLRHRIAALERLLNERPVTATRR